MKKTLSATLALGLGLGLGVSGADAQNRSLQGSDTLYDLTNTMLGLCGIDPANMIYVGGGSTGAGTQMAAGNQQIGPQSRFLSSSECTKPAPYNRGQGIAAALDGLAIFSDDTEATTCNTLRFQGDMPVAASANGNTTVECPNCVDTNSDGVLDTYQFTEWQQALRIIYAGQHAPVNLNACSTSAPSVVGNSTVGNAAFSKFCDSDVRFTLVNTWANMFETGCVDGECTALKHAFRRDDISGTTDTFLTLLSLPSIGSAPTLSNAPFCNGTEFDDEDPIRRECDGNGQSTNGENVCRRTTRAREGSNVNPSPTVAVNGPVTAANAPPTNGRGDLGLVLPIITPEILADQWPNTNVCIAGGFGGPFRYAPMPASLLPGPQQLCPNGIARGFARCLWPVDASGNFGCVNSAQNRPAGAAGFANAMDGRVYNMTPRRLDGTIPTTPRKVGTSIVQRPLHNVGFYRIHSRTVLPSAAGSTTCRLPDSTEQIGCLVHASPCSLGFAGLAADANDPNKPLALRTPLSHTAGGVAVLPTVENVRRLTEDCATGQYASRYPLSRKLYLNTLIGFNAVTNTAGTPPVVTQEAQLVNCFMDRRFLDRAATASGFIPLSDSSCITQPLPADPTSFTTPTECDMRDRNPASEIDLCPGVTYP